MSKAKQRRAARRAEVAATRADAREAVRLAEKASYLRRCVTRLLDCDSLQHLTHEVACHIPSPEEVNLLPVSARAKKLRASLLNRVRASDKVEKALEHVLELAVELDR